MIIVAGKPQQLQTGDTLSVSSEMVNGHRINYTAAVPANPSIGDLWMECDANGLPIYSYFWTWDGTRWLSPEQYIQFNFSAISMQTNYYFDIGNIGTRAIRFVERSIRTLSSLSQSSINYWAAAAYTVPSSNTPIAMASQQNTQTNAANSFVYQSASLTLNTGQPLLQLTLTPNGAPGTLTGTARFKYYYYRQ